MVFLGAFTIAKPSIRPPPGLNRESTRMHANSPGPESSIRVYWRPFAVPYFYPVSMRVTIPRPARPVPSEGMGHPSPLHPRPPANNWTHPLFGSGGAYSRRAIHFQGDGCGGDVRFGRNGQAR